MDEFQKIILNEENQMQKTMWLHLLNSGKKQI